jgi:hypothetical protein
LGACAELGHAPAPPETDANALERLRGGDAVLSCDSAACGEAWRRNQADIIRRYNAGEWRELALLVMRTDYSQDLAYFYLGRAAEGLGAARAALGYYRTAITLATGPAADARCAANASGCGGLSLLNELALHTHLVDATLHRGVFTQGRRRPGQAGESRPVEASPPAAADGWIDPPPASQ